MAAQIGELTGELFYEFGVSFEIVADRMGGLAIEISDVFVKVSGAEDGFAWSHVVSQMGEIGPLLVKLPVVFAISSLASRGFLVTGGKLNA